MVRDCRSNIDVRLIHPLGSAAAARGEPRFFDKGRGIQMRKAWFALAAALLLVGALATGAAGAPDQRGAEQPSGRHYKSYNDNLMGAHARQQYELTQKALQAKLEGKAKGKTFEVEIGQHALLQR